jgi:hypothetical protein
MTKNVFIALSLTFVLAAGNPLHGAGNGQGAADPENPGNLSQRRETSAEGLRSVANRFAFSATRCGSCLPFRVFRKRI